MMHLTKFSFHSIFGRCISILSLLVRCLKICEKDKLRLGHYVSSLIVNFLIFACNIYKSYFLIPLQIATDCVKDMDSENMAKGGQKSLIDFLKERQVEEALLRAMEKDKVALCVYILFISPFLKESKVLEKAHYYVTEMM